jgi:hypothetical protein
LEISFVAFCVFVLTLSAQENYEFVVAADAWKLIASDAVRAQRLCELQAQFFLDSSPKQINLPAKSFKPLKEVVCPVPAQIPVIATTFLDDARSIIFRLLEKDTFPRFRTSGKPNCCDFVVSF